MANRSTSEPGYFGKQHQLHVTHNATMVALSTNKEVDDASEEKIDQPSDKRKRTSVGDAPAGPSPFGANEPEEETTFTEVTTNDVLVASVGDIETTLSNAKMSHEEILEKWKADLCSAESFEKLCPARLVEIHKEAYLIESTLLEKNQKMRAQLQNLAKISAM